MPKRYLGFDVMTAARERVAWTFETFERVYLSFSAGKDSTVMLHIVADEARRRGRKFGLMLVDLEGQYKLTIEHALECIEMYRDLIELHWVCLPIALRNAVSVFEPKWLSWDPDKEEIWIRKPPDHAVVSPDEYPFFSIGMEFEEFVPEFGEWFAGGKLTACLVGIRSDESLNRYRTIASDTKKRLDGRQYTSGVTENVFNVYPIYDWKTQDIWRYHGKNPEKPYNKLYDRMNQAGLSIHMQRICQPYGDDQRRGLWLFHLIEPETWARVVARVNGANSGALYMQEWGNVNGYRKITKPVGHTWQTFAELLIASMPPHMEEHYRNKVLLFQKWWCERGYPEGIPDEADPNMEAKRRAPSWRRVCKTLLRNDYWGKGIGFSQQKSSGYSKYLDLMRRRREEWGVRDGQLEFM